MRLCEPCSSAAHMPAWNPKKYHHVQDYFHVRHAHSLRAMLRSRVGVAEKPLTLKRGTGLCIGQRRAFKEWTLHAMLSALADSLVHARACMRSCAIVRGCVMCRRCWRVPRHCSTCRSSSHSGTRTPFGAKHSVRRMLECPLHRRYSMRACSVRRVYALVWPGVDGERLCESLCVLRLGRHDQVTGVKTNLETLAEIEKISYAYPPMPPRATQRPPARPPCTGAAALLQSQRRQRFIRTGWFSSCV